LLTRRELFEKAYGENFEAAEAHNCTFSGSAMVCVAAHAALDLLTDEVLSGVAEKGAAFRKALTEALRGLPLFREVRGEGLIVGIQLEPTRHPWLSFEHFGMSEMADRESIGPLLCHRLYKRGYFCFVCGHDWTVLRILPRFDIEPAALAAATKAIREELSFL